jgi:choline kinase
MQTSQATPSPAPTPSSLATHGAPIAILLAAGVGRRLGETHDGPKVLLDFAGRSLIERHLAALAAVGVTDIMVTVGHEAATLAAALRARAATVLNPDYRQGSLVSLWVQRERLRAGRPVLLMDGDVLYDRRVLERLVAAPGEAVLLVDRELEPGDEPVKVCFRGETMVDFRKTPEHDHDWHGESVGFFKFGPAMAARLADACDRYVAAGRTDVEYEEAIRDLMLADPAGFSYVDVTDLPWTEIDFPEDVAKARDAILPHLVS